MYCLDTRHPPPQGAIFATFGGSDPPESARMAVFELPRARMAGLIWVFIDFTAKVGIHG